MNPVRHISAILKKVDKSVLDPTEQAVRAAAVAFEHKIESMRNAEGPEAAAMAAATVAAEAETAAKIAKASAKSARKKATEYRKGAAKAAGTASAAEADAVAKDAAATRMSQSDAIDEVEGILSRENPTSSADSTNRNLHG